MEEPEDLDGPKDPQLLGSMLSGLQTPKQSRTLDYAGRVCIMNINFATCLKQTSWFFTASTLLCLRTSGVSLSKLVAFVYPADWASSLTARTVFLTIYGTIFDLECIVWGFQGGIEQK